VFNKLERGDHDVRSLYDLRRGIWSAGFVIAALGVSTSGSISGNSPGGVSRDGQRKERPSVRSSSTEMVSIGGGFLSVGVSVPGTVRHAGALGLTNCCSCWKALNVNTQQWYDGFTDKAPGGQNPLPACTLTGEVDCEDPHEESQVMPQERIERKSGPSASSVDSASMRGLCEQADPDAPGYQYWYLGDGANPHKALIPVSASYDPCEEFHSGCEEEEVTALEEAVQNASSAAIGKYLALVPTNRILMNGDRKAIQVLGCSGWRIVAQFPIEMIAAEVLRSFRSVPPAVSSGGSPLPEGRVRSRQVHLAP
jgi:hypothetical protein